MARWLPCTGAMVLPCRGQVNVWRVLINTENWGHKPAVTKRRYRWGILLRAFGLGSYSSEITAMLQSSHDEWAVIGTENCSPVASGEWPREVLSPKWNQSAAHVLVFLPRPHVVKTLSHLYTDARTNARSQRALIKWTIPSKSKPTGELFGGKIWQYVLPLVPEALRPISRPLAAARWGHSAPLTASFVLLSNSSSGRRRRRRGRERSGAGWQVCALSWC